MNAIESPELSTLFMRRMDSALAAKLTDILPNIQACVPTDGPLSIVSLGAGTGKVEQAIAYALPNAHVYALDYQLQMIEEIGKHMKLPDGKHNLHAIRADINYPPVAQGSADAVVASSVVHEIASFHDKYDLWDHTETFFQNSALLLKPGGVFILRDFVQPEEPKESLVLKIGTKQSEDDANPAAFLKRFVGSFKGVNLSYIQEQIQDLEKIGAYKEGATLDVYASDALEIVAHYSWAKRFDDEVKERYAYLPLSLYTQYIRSCFEKVGVDTTIIKEHAYVQSGYPEHIDGRLDLLHLDTGKPYEIPPFTGVIALQRI